MTLARLEQSLSPCLHCPAAFPPRSCAPCPPKAAKPLDTGWGQHRNHKQSEASRRAQGWTDSVCPKAGRGDFSLPRQTGINFPADLCHGAISVLPTASKLLPGGLLPFSLANKPGVLVFLLSCFCTKEAAVGEVQGVPRCRVPMPCSLCWGMLPAPSALGQSLDPSLGHSGTLRDSLAGLLARSSERLWKRSRDVPRSQASREGRDVRNPSRSRGFPGSGGSDGHRQPCPAGTRRWPSSRGWLWRTSPIPTRGTSRSGLRAPGSGRIPQPVPGSSLRGQSQLCAVPGLSSATGEPGISCRQRPMSRSTGDGEGGQPHLG